MICPHCNEFVPDANYRCPKCRKVVKEEFDMVDLRPKPPKREGLNFNHFLVFIVIVGLGFIAYLIYDKYVDITPVETDTVQTARQSTQQARQVTPGSETTPGEGETGAVPQGSGDDIAGGEPQEQQAGETEIVGDAQNTGESGTETGGESGEPESDDPYAWVENEDDNEAVTTHVPGTEVDIEKMLHRGKTTIFDFYSAYCGPCVRMSPKLEELQRKRDDIVVVKIDINREGIRGIDWNSPVIKQYRISSIPYFIVYNAGGTLIHKAGAASQYVNALLSQENLQ